MNGATFLSQRQTENIFGASYEEGHGYAVGDHVVRNGVVMICQATIAEVPVYDSTQAYAAGDRVRYPGDMKLEKGVYSCDDGVAAGTPFTIEEWTRVRLYDATQWTMTSIDALKADLSVVNQKYVKPATGIPASDMAAAVQTSLGKADTAIQSHQDISGKQDKLTAGSNVTITNFTSYYWNVEDATVTGGYSVIYTKNATPEYEQGAKAYSDEACTSALSGSVYKRPDEYGGGYYFDTGSSQPTNVTRDATHDKAHSIIASSDASKANVSDFSIPQGGGSPSAQYVSNLFTENNTSLVGQINYTVGASGNPADHTVRTLGTLAAATTLTIAAPRTAGALRDFAITFTEPATAVGVTFSTTDAAGSSLTFVGEFLAPAASKTYIYYLTEIAANTFLVKGQELTTVTPPTI